VFILSKIYYFLIDTIQTILLAAAVFIVIYMFFLRPFQVTGLSMYPTFHDQEYVLTNLIGLRFGDLKRGDVVVFTAPRDAEKDYIKRVIGLPGETVGIKDGDIYVNNLKLNESAYLKDVKTNGGASLREGQTEVIPPDQYFVLGDNRPYSSDSREWGFVKKSAIIGLSFYVYWPLDRMRMVKNPFN